MRKNIAIYASSPEVRDYLSWRLWDPYFLAVGIPSIETSTPTGGVDLAILGDRPYFPERRGVGRNDGAKDAGCTDKSILNDFAAGVRTARGVIAVQPASLGAAIPDSLSERLGVQLKGWRHETPPYSTITRHPVLRLLGRSAGMSVMPHILYEWRMEIEAPPDHVLTVMSDGMPDVIWNGKAAVVATNLFADLVRFYRHPEFPDYETGAALLLVNLARVTLGFEPVSVPASKLYQEWRYHFYGYAYGRQFINQLAQLKTGSLAPGIVEEVRERMGRADERIAGAAQRLLQADGTGTRSRIDEAAEELLACRQALTSVQPYFVRGWHGGILSNRVVDGELVGYAEWGWPSHTMRWVETRLASAERLGAKQINEVPGQTWDVVADHGLTDLERWRRAEQAGLIETVKGMYSDSYLEILGTESNVRQFEFGLKALRRIGAKVRTFICAVDDFAFHPQLPQILRGFGFEFAVLRCGGPGKIKEIDAEQVLWEGLDGVGIPAVPTYHTVPTSWLAGVGGAINRMAETLAMAEKAGFKTVLSGSSQDATMGAYAEREYESFNTVAPVQVSLTTFAEYFEAIRDRRDSAPRVFLSVDDLLGRPDYWTGFGSLNAYCREDRRVERLLVAAEKFSVFAMQRGLNYPAGSLDEAWKNLLSYQDHFTYGCGGPDNPEGFHVGGLQQPLTPGYPGPRTPITTDQTAQEWKRAAEEAAQAALEEAARCLVSVETAQEGSGATCVAVFNALNWNRSGEVRVWAPAAIDARSVVVTDGEKTVPAAILDMRVLGDTREALVAFRAETPSLGYRVYSVAVQTKASAAGAQDNDPTCLENPFLAVEINPATGGLGRLHNKATGHEMLRSGEETRWGCSEPIINSFKDVVEATVVWVDALGKAIRIKGRFADCPYECVYSLGRETRWLEINLTIDYGEGAIFGFKGRPETLLRAAFPFATGNERWINQPFGVYRTEGETQVALDFVDLAGNKGGVALMNDGMPGLFFRDGDTHLLISDGFPPLRGVHIYRYALYTHAGDWRTGDVLRLAHEFQQPLLPMTFDNASVPQAGSFLQTTDGIILSGLNVTDGRTRARFYAADARACSVETQWARAWDKAFAARLDGSIVGSLPIDGDRISFDLEPGKIATFILSQKERVS